MTQNISIIPELFVLGAGPGDPELITIKGYRILKEADLILAEDTRTSAPLLKHFDIHQKVFSHHQHNEHQSSNEIVKFLKEGKNIAIISEAGCPGIADPGQILVYEAQKLNIEIKPLVGPSSILLALMASGFNGQHFSFLGYLPIDHTDRIKKIKQIEEESSKRKCTQIFIETPYRNNKLFETILINCNSSTQLCIAAELTSANEFIKTKSITDWKKEKIDLHKKPVIFLLMA